MTKKDRSISTILRVSIFSLILIALSSGSVFAQTVILNQGPNRVNAYASDLSYTQTIAENFVVSSTVDVSQIRIWGIYATIGGAPPSTDNFTVIFHADSAGLPGAAIATQNNVPVSRVATGGNVVTFAEYVYTLTLATPVNLSPGNYWVEIYNDTSSITDDFYWELGTVDPLNGIPNSAFAFGAAPGISWSATSQDYAIEITSGPLGVKAVPTMTEWGMIIFMALAGLGSMVYLRKQRKTSR